MISYGLDNILQPYDFEEWINKFDILHYKPITDYVRALQTDEVSLTISFSSEKVKNCYGIKSVKEEILKRWNHNKIKEILNEDCKFDESLIEYLAGCIREIYDEDIEEVLAILHCWSKIEGILKLGSYNHKDKTIILYKTAIMQEVRKNYIPFRVICEDVFVHELFHAFHYAYASQSNKPSCDITARHDYTSIVVKEALASRYELEYCSKYGICDIVCGLQDTWRNTIPDVFPYAAARYLKNSAHIIQVLEASVDDMDVALRRMLDNAPPMVFYDIKNSVNRGNVTIKKYLPTSVSAKQKKVKPNIVCTPTSKDFLHDFKEYLNLEYGKGTVNSYISYINSAFSKYFNIQNVFQVVGVDIIGYLAEKLHAVLTELLKYPSMTKDTVKTIRNYRSALNVLIAFSVGYDGVSINASTQVVQEKIQSGNAIPSNLIPSSNFYDRKELSKIFKSRLITQDRDYSGGSYFPCRVLNKLFSKKPDYKNLLSNVIDKTVFLLDSGRKTVLKDIEGVSFENGAVFVILKGGIKESLYTEVHTKGQSVRYEEISTDLVKDLSLDHDIPLIKLFNDNLGSSPNMKALSDGIVAYKKVNKDKSKKKSELATNFLREKYGELKIDEVELFNELCKLYDKVKLTVMLTKYNSSKNMYSGGINDAKSM